jgi:hypothetical protein
MKNRALTKTILATFLTLFLTLISAAAASDPQDPSGGMMSLYRGATSVHVRASVYVEINRGGDDLVTGQGIYEYWEEGDNFRLSYWLSPDLGVMGNLEYAYDGTYYQLHLVGDSTVHLEDSPKNVRKDDLLLLTAPIPSPFHLPIQPIVPSVDECSSVHCLPTLRYLHDAKHWQKFGKQAHRGSERDSGVRIHAPGGSEGGYDFEYEIGLRPSSQGPEELTTIEKIGKDGEVISAVTFSDFETVNSGRVQGKAANRFPMMMTYQVMNPGGVDRSEPVLRVRYKLETLEIDSDLNDQVFTIAVDETMDVAYNNQPIQKRTTEKSIWSSPEMIGRWPASSE